MRKRLRTGRAGNDDGFTMIPSWFETPRMDQTLRSRSWRRCAIHASTSVAARSSQRAASLGMTRTKRLLIFLTRSLPVAT